MNTNKLLEPGAVARIAEEYSLVRDQFKDIPFADMHKIRRFICRQFNDLSKRLYFDFTLHDPYLYEGIEEMRQDLTTFYTIRVNTSGNQSDFWGPVYNLFFRAIHDYIHAYHNLNFTYEDEVEAFKKQMDFSKNYKLDFYDLNWPLYEKILRSEIVYQAAYKTHYRVFHLPEQKIILDDL